MITVVVIAIIAILSAILFPVVAQARRKARTSSCLSNVKQIGTAVQVAEEVKPSLPADWWESWRIQNMDTATVSVLIESLDRYGLDWRVVSTLRELNDVVEQAEREIRYVRKDLPYAPCEVEVARLLRAQKDLRRALTEAGWAYRERMALEARIA